MECCDNCTPELLDKVRPRTQLKQKRRLKGKRGVPAKTTQAKLFDWRRKIYERDHTDSTFSQSGILPNALIEILASVGPALKTNTRLLDDLTQDWLWRDEYLDELRTFLSTTHVPQLVPLPKNTGSRGKKRAGEPSAGSSMAEGKKRRLDATSTAITTSTDYSQPLASSSQAESIATTTAVPLATNTGVPAVDVYALIAAELARRAALYPESHQ
jgi:hypothetical protein